MDADVIITLSILAAAIILFVTEWVRLDVVALLVVVALMVTEILTPAEALEGFANTAVWLLIALFVVGGAVFRTGLAASLGDRILNVAGKQENRLLVVIMLTVAVMSAFISNTGTVAVLMPAVLALATSLKISPSRLMIPLAFASSLGGAMTLIGTPPNLVISEELRQAGFEPFNFFAFLPIGAILVASGTIFMLFIKRFIPERAKQTTINTEEMDETLLQNYRLPESIFKLRVRSVSPLIGVAMRDTAFSEYEVNVLEIHRPVPAQPIAQMGNQRLMVQKDDQVIDPDGDFVLQRDDVMFLRGEEEAVQHLVKRYTLALQPTTAEDREALISKEVGIAEVVIPPESSLTGQTISKMRFGDNYGLHVLNLRRPGTDDQMNVGKTELRFGDVLLVQGRYDRIAALEKRPNELLLISPEAIQARIFNRRKAPITLLILGAMLILLVLQVFPAVVTTMLAATAIILTGCMSMDEAYDSIDWKSILLIGGMIPLSTALVKVGLVEEIATQFTTSLGASGPVVVMAGLFVLTVVLTQVLSNTATAVLLAPIGIAIAANLGVRPQAFMMSIAVAASLAFATPTASPVNVLVMSAGNYRFTDYARVGIPLILITAILAILVLPLIFPF